jgi:hypothetical protein
MLVHAGGELVAIKQLADEFTRHLYLPRLADSQVLLDGSAERNAIISGADARNFAGSAENCLDTYSYGCPDWVPQPSAPDAAKSLVEPDAWSGAPTKPHQGLISKVRKIVSAE